MFMAPITAARAPVSPTLRRVTGAVVLPLSAVVMVPFLAGYAVYALIALALRGLVKAPHALVECVDYAGTAVLGADRAVRF